MSLYFLRGLSYRELKKKDKAFSALKMARKQLEMLKEARPKFFRKMKDLIDETILGFK